ncbi:MAG TPA: diaminopimelate decarboxylase [Anaerolineales bacterium]|nr:diaminopimelate decarboxylase [Anaerolineales bacterium]
MAVNNPAPFLIADRLALFPDSTRIRNDTLTVGGCSLASLADQYGTPLYVYDRLTMDASVAAYRGALRAHYPAASDLTYAGKAFLCKAIAQWTQEHHLWLDCTGEGEIAIAAAGKAQRENILVHGVNKSAADLRSAVQGAGTIVVDNLAELRRLAKLFPLRQSAFPELWLRLQPGIAVATHHVHTQTGQQESKFGMGRDEIIEAAAFCRRNHLPLSGIHFHLGSNFRNPEPLIPAIDLALELSGQIGLEERWHFCPGGGWSVAYHEDELPQPGIEDYVRGVAQAVIEGCQARGLSLPHLHLEPGRSLIARAGVAIYCIGAVKRRGGRTWVLTDGGMADNLRHALYGARYSCVTVKGLGREMSGKVSIAGPYCESGDVVVEDLLMPQVEEGELIAVPVSGAYHLSMSSNYNGARRPAVLWLEAGHVKEIVRRETIADLLKRDQNLL